MRVVIPGATGNVGTALVAALAADPSITELVGTAWSSWACCGAAGT